MCVLNSKLQDSYMTVASAWLLVKQLKNDFQNILSSLSAGRFQEFPYLEGLNRTQKDTFMVITKTLLLNLDIRFPCPSFSIDKRIAYKHTDQNTQQLSKQFLSKTQHECPINVLVGLFLFPDDLIKNQQINPFFISGKFPEIPIIASEILVKQEEIRAKAIQLTNGDAENTTPPTITLMDVFHVVERDRYPHLWSVVVRAMSCMPTSASCEQSFSCLKHRLHENMKKTNAFNFLLTSQSNSMIRF